MTGTAFFSLSFWNMLHISALNKIANYTKFLLYFLIWSRWPYALVA